MLCIGGGTYGGALASHHCHAGAVLLDAQTQVPSPSKILLLSSLPLVRNVQVFSRPGVLRFSLGDCTSFGVVAVLSYGWIWSTYVVHVMFGFSTEGNTIMFQYIMAADRNTWMLNLCLYMLPE